MALTEHYYTKFEEGNFYHVFNRSVDRKPMFKNEGNYEFFLKKYYAYLSNVIDTYTYCLLENHFHLLVRVKEQLTAKLSNTGAFNKEITTHDIVSHQFRKFFQSYAMAFNLQQNRTGTLFQTPFKRALVTKQQYLTKLLYYIHSNPQWHGLTDNFREWKWSSYNAILNDKPSKLMKEHVIEWFGNRDLFKQFHEQMHNVKIDRKYYLEDEPPKVDKSFERVLGMLGIR